MGFASVWAFDRRSLDLTLAKIRLEGQSLVRNFSFAMPSTPHLSAPAAAMKRFLEQPSQEIAAKHLLSNGKCSVFPSPQNRYVSPRFTNAML